MSEFVEECRREWTRLGVADHYADEMAAELAADLEEAEAEGALAEDVFGSGTDPRALATAWATERGLVPGAQSDGWPRRRRIASGAAAATFALVAIAGAALVILASPSTPKRLAAGLPDGSLPGQLWIRRLPSPSAAPSRLASGDAWTITPQLPAGAAALSPDLHVIAFSATATGAPVFTVDIDDSDAGMRRVGTILLIVGLAGLVAFTMLLWWAGRVRPQRRTA